MIIKPILEKIKDYLQDTYNISCFTKSGLRLAYVVYLAYITSDDPIKQSNELLQQAYDLSQDDCSYVAFERSVYREIKNAFINNDEGFIILEVIYNLAKGLKI